MVTFLFPQHHPHLHPKSFLPTIATCALPDVGWQRPFTFEAVGLDPLLGPSSEQRSLIDLLNSQTTSDPTPTPTLTLSRHIQPQLHGGRYTLSITYGEHKLGVGTCEEAAG